LPSFPADITLCCDSCFKTNPQRHNENGAHCTKD
jgi:hypothetical protein